MQFSNSNVSNALCDHGFILGCPTLMPRSCGALLGMTRPLLGLAPEYCGLLLLDELKMELPGMSYPFNSGWIFILTVQSSSINTRCLTFASALSLLFPAVRSFFCD